MIKKLWEKLVDRIIYSALDTPYFHLTDYMNRWWFFGAYNESRNDDNPRWKFDSLWQQRAFRYIMKHRRGRLYHWLTDRLAARVHETRRSDNERHLHDHPWWSISIILRGGYWEVLPVYDTPTWRRQSQFGNMPDCEYTRLVWRGPGSIIFRRAKSRHRLLLSPGKTCWSLFIMGKKSNDWGFYTPQGKIPWRQYEAQQQFDFVAPDIGDEAAVIT